MRLPAIGRSGLFAVLATAAGLFAASSSWSEEKKSSATPEQIERARELVQIIDNMHKAYVIHVTATYVRAQESVPAASVARKVYQHMEQNKFFSGRLIDASGKPLNIENAPKTEFEKKVVAALKSGKKYYDEVATVNGKTVLRAGTIVPAVMKQCTVCHTGTKEGDLLGALVYEVPVK